MRFRPNIIVDGLEPWKEFDLIGKTIRCIPENRQGAEDRQEGVGEEHDRFLELKVISTTVRCAGVGVDPQDPDREVLDIPQLLSRHFPERGPYLGVYAVIQTPGSLHIGDTLKFVD